MTELTVFHSLESKPGNDKDLVRSAQLFRIHELRLTNFQVRDCSLLLICWWIGRSPLTNRATRTQAAGFSS